MAMRSKQRQTTLPFPVLIIELCRQARVPRDAKKEVEIILISSTNIWRIKAKYLKDQADKMEKAALVDLSPIVVIDSIPAEKTLPTSALGPLGTSIATATFADTSGSSVAALPPRHVAVVVSRTPITHASLPQMGQLTQFVDRQAARLETSIPDMIQTALTDVVTPLRATIDALEAIIVVCEHDPGATREVTA
uniref:Polyprotein protein n=1 Tax=Solanum tuberosum TaxID=4113 RepID=M1DJT9_SOLTU